MTNDHDATLLEVKDALIIASNCECKYWKKHGLPEEQLLKIKAERAHTQARLDALIEDVKKMDDIHEVAHATIQAITEAKP